MSEVLRMNKEPSFQEQLMRFILSKWVSKPIHVAAELGIADLLAEGQQDVEELARRTRSDPDALYRVMRALASVGIFVESEKRRFGLNPMASLLQSGSLRSAARTFHSEWNDRAWMHLLEGVQTGQTPFEAAFGCSLIEWLENHPEEGQVLHQANSVRSAQYNRAVLECYDFSPFSTLVDVGSGYGMLLAEILGAFPQAKGVLVDRAPVLAEAKRMLETRGVSERCTFVSCDFVDQVPPGGDVYLLSNVLHDWPDERAVVILRNCRRAMRPDCRLLILEMIVPGGNQPSAAKLLDLEMLVVTGGKERTEEEFRSLLESAGFALARVIPIGQEMYVLEAFPD
jgi:SAM-dependent methyltransferase